MKWPHTVTLLRAPLVDGGSGQKYRNWDAAVEKRSPANVQTTNSTEVEDGSQITVTVRNLYLPAGTDLLTTDRVSINGTVHEVDGDVEDWTRGGRGNIKAKLRLVTPRRGGLS